MIRTIDFTNRQLVQQLFELQKGSYLIEAKLVQFFEIPPLKENFQDFLQCKETFLGFFEDNKLVGALSYDVEEHQLTICRVVVHPLYFRKGIAQNLLDGLMKFAQKIPLIKVATAKDNVPAKNFYKKNGFRLMQNIEAAPNFYISNFEKRRF